MMNTAAPTPARAWRWREREWGWIALCSVLLCGVFSLWPQLDLALSALFIDGRGRFVGDSVAPVRALYLAVPWVGRALVVVALLAWLRPRAMRWRRPLLALGLSLLLGVGLVVNGGLKEHWGRERPGPVLAGGAAQRYSPALRPVAHCASNCSFVSGHAATGFALMSAGLLGTPRTRRRWLVIGWAGGLLVGLGRVAQGGHFASDVLFAGLVVWACHALLREGWLRVVAARRRSQYRSGTNMSAGTGWRK